EDRRLDVAVARAAHRGDERLADGEHLLGAGRQPVEGAFGCLEGHQIPRVGPACGAASLRYGLVARSRPIVVCGPWPGRTTVSSGSGRHLVARLRRIVG